MSQRGKYVLGVVLIFLFLELSNIEEIELALNSNNHHLGDYFVLFCYAYSNHLKHPELLNPQEDPAGFDFKTWQETRPDEEHGDCPICSLSLLKISLCPCFFNETTTRVLDEEVYPNDTQKSSKITNLINGIGFDIV